MNKLIDYFKKEIERKIWYETDRNEGWLQECERCGVLYTMRDGIQMCDICLNFRITCMICGSINKETFHNYCEDCIDEMMQNKITIDEMIIKYKDMWKKNCEEIGWPNDYIEHHYEYRNKLSEMK